MSLTSDFKIRNGVLTGYTGQDRMVRIPEGVTEIGAYALQRCSSLTELFIPESVHIVGHAVLAGCTNLSRVTIPENLTERE